MTQPVNAGYALWQPYSVLRFFAALVGILLLSGCYYSSLVAVVDDIDKVKSKVAGGSDVNERGMTSGHPDTPLIVAAHEGHLEVATFLLDNGADPNRRSTVRVTALHKSLSPISRPAAVEKRREDIALLLMSRGADIEARLDSARAAWQGPDVSIPSRLRVYTDTSDLNFTPLMLAAASAKPRAVRALLDRGADPNSTTDAGWTALHYSALWGNVDITSLLLKAGAKPVALEINAPASFSSGIVAAVAAREKLLDGQASPTDVLSDMRNAVALLEKARGSSSGDRDASIARANAISVASFLLAVVSATTDANIQAKQMATFSRSGKGYGFGFAPYTIQRTDSIRNMYDFIEAMAGAMVPVLNTALACKTLVDDAAQFRACVQEVLAEPVRTSANDPSIAGSEKFIVLEGGYCNETDDCVRSLACSNHNCVKPFK